jgi:hypothetical protein
LCLLIKANICIKSLFLSIIVLTSFYQYYKLNLETRRIHQTAPPKLWVKITELLGIFVDKKVNSSIHIVLIASLNPDLFTSTISIINFTPIVLKLLSL